MSAYPDAGPVRCLGSVPDCRRNACTGIAGVRGGLACALAAFGLAVSSAWAADFSALALDFLVQNVCVDSNGRSVPGRSPLDGSEICSAHRDLKRGERLVYHKHDWANDASRAQRPEGLQRSDSVPVDVSGPPLVSNQFDFGMPPRVFGRFDPGEGGQLMAVDGRLASVLLTEDSKGMKFFYGPNCVDHLSREALRASWILFDDDLLANPSGSAITRLRQSLDASACPHGLDRSLTIWRLGGIRFRRDQNHRLTMPLQTLITDHYSRDRIEDSGSMERMFFTRELGWTRWERWQNLRVPGKGTVSFRKRADRLAQSGRCRARTDVPPDGDWLLVDCREWTNIRPPDSAVGDPPGFWISAAIRQEPLQQLIRN